MDFEDREDKLSPLEYQVKKEFLKFLTGFKKISSDGATILVSPTDLGPLLGKYAGKVSDSTLINHKETGNQLKTADKEILGLHKINGGEDRNESADTNQLKEWIPYHLTYRDAKPEAIISELHKIDGGEDRNESADTNQVREWIPNHLTCRDAKPEAIISEKAQNVDVPYKVKEEYDDVPNKYNASGEMHVYKEDPLNRDENFNITEDPFGYDASADVELFNANITNNFQTNGDTFNNIQSPSTSVKSQQNGVNDVAKCATDLQLEILTISNIDVNVTPYVIRSDVNGAECIAPNNVGNCSPANVDISDASVASTTSTFLTNDYDFDNTQSSNISVVAEQNVANDVVSSDIDLPQNILTTSSLNVNATPFVVRSALNVNGPECTAPNNIETQKTKFDKSRNNVPQQGYYLPEQDYYYLPEEDYYYIPDDDYHLSEQDYQSPQQNGNLPQQNCQSSQQDCQPSQQDCQPSQQDCQPSQQDCYLPQKDYHPSQQDYQPLQKDSYPPQQDNYPPQQDNYPPQQHNYPPQQDSYPLQQDSYLPEQDNYPPQQDYPLQQDYHPPQQDYHPPQQDYHSPQQDYHLPQQDYHPPQQDYYPPQQDYYPPQQVYQPLQKIYHPPTKDYYVPHQNYRNFRLGHVPIAQEERYYPNDYTWDQYESWPIKNYIIELYNFPTYFTTSDLLSIYVEKPRYIKWCDNNHALLVTSSSQHAFRALDVHHPYVLSRPMNMASQIAVITSDKFLLKPATREDKQQSTTSGNMFPRQQLQGQQRSTVNLKSNSTNLQLQPTQDAKPGIPVSASQESSTFMHIRCPNTSGSANAEIIDCMLNKSISDTNVTVVSQWRDFFINKKALIEQICGIFSRKLTMVLSSEDYDQFQSEVYQKLGHIIELYKIPWELDASKLLNIYKEEPRMILFCDVNSAILITGSVEQAERALKMTPKILKSRTMVEASLSAVVSAIEIFPKIHWDDETSSSKVISVACRDNLAPAIDSNGVSPQASNLTEEVGQGDHGNSFLQSHIVFSKTEGGKRKTIDREG